MKIGDEKRWRMILRVFAVAAAILPVAACATKLDASNAARIKTIQVEAAEEPKYYAYSYFVAHQDPVIVDGVDDFNTLMAHQNLRLNTEWKVAVSDALRADGYEIQDGGAAHADAVLTLKVAGFLPGQAGPSYAAHGASLEPEFMLRATLRDAQSNRKLFERFYVFDDPTFKPLDGTILFVPDHKYYFATARDLFSKPDLAAEGFRSALPLVTQDIGQAFKRQ